MNPELKSTRNYSLFTIDPTNRPVGSITGLVDDMKVNGFLAAYPLHVVRRNGKLVIIDGQHRFAAAQVCGIPVYYVILKDNNVSIPKINGLQHRWVLNDYVESYANQGKQDYIVLRDYSLRTGIHYRAAASLMIGQCADSGNVCEKLKADKFKVKTVAYANKIADIVEESEKHVKWARHQGYLGALSRCLFVKEFNVRNYIKTISRHPRLLVHEGNKAEFLEMIENIVNYRSTNKIPLAFLARQAASKRSVA